MTPHILSHQAYTKTPVYAINNPLFLLAFLLVLLPTWVSAQITGRVVDTAGNTLEGVHISALHNGAETTSGADGSFSLELLEDQVGIRGREILERNGPSAQGVHLQMNLHSGQVEVHAQGGVFDLQGKFLRVVESAGVYRYGEKGALRKALAQADTLVFVKAGYVTVRVEITDDAVDLGDVAMQAYGSLTDSRDGKVYRTVTIGTQTWMAENLNYESTSGSYCYGNDLANCDTYGRLYSWDAAMAGAVSSSKTPSGVQGVCPEGWHLPSDDEWTILSNYVITNSAGTSTSNIGPYLKSSAGWFSGGNGTDAFGFSGLPGGDRSHIGNYNRVGTYGYWWSSTESGSSTAYYRNLYYAHRNFLRSNESKFRSLSVRCLVNTIPTIRASQISPKYPVVGELVSFTADTTGIYNEPSGLVVTWSVNGGAFGSVGVDFTYVPTSHGKDTLIAKVVQNDKEAFDTVYIKVYATLTDSRDNQEYLYITIGTQTWMAENLNYESTSGSYCYDDDPANCDTYGRLYTWAVAMGGAPSSSTTPSGVQGVCPVGWHLPSDGEWEALAEFVATETGLTDKSDDHWTQLGPKLKSTTGWGWGSGGNGTDAFGFSGIPGGALYSSGSYYYGGSFGLWLSSTKSSSAGVYYRYLSPSNDVFYRSNYNGFYAYSVRCIKD
jgi:uncharacterized protein (TIGR02145 family)